MRVRHFAQAAGLGLCLFAGRLDAQLYPMPGSTAEAPVFCTGCPGNNSDGIPNDGLPTYPYASPLVDFVGRFVDSQQTANFQHVGIRTARARFIRAYPAANGQAPPRIYIQIGNALGAYSLGSFFSQKLPAGPVSIGSMMPGVDRWGAPLEKITRWESFMYPEARDSGWFAPLIDQQDPMAKGGPFDVDDRGYIYGSWPTFGWGIARDDGRSTGVHFPKVVQLLDGVENIDQTKYPNTINDPSNVVPDSILVVREGASYYAVTAASGSEGRSVYDVTTPATPQLLGIYPGVANAMLRYDRSDTAGRVAYIDGTRALQVYTYANLITNGAPVLTATSTETGGFKAVTFDEAGDIWVIGSTKVTRFTVAGSSYVPTEFTPFAGLSGMRALSVRSGRIAVIGRDASPAYDVRVARIEAGGPVEIDLNGFFQKYYHRAPAGYAQPGLYSLPSDIELVQWNGKTYLMYSAEGLGDVFELQNPDAPACDAPTSVGASISGSSSTCSTGTGGTASVAVGGGGAVTYQWGWRATSGSPIQQIDGATSAAYQLAGSALGPAGAKELVVTVTSACGAPLLSNAIPITVTTPPAIAMSADSSVSAYSSGNIASVTDPGGATFAWTVVNGTIESGQGTASILYTAGSNGYAKVTATVTANGCVVNRTVFVPIETPAGATMLYLVTPCRVHDTRDSGSPVENGTTRSVAVAGSCGVPAGAVAVSANITVVAPASPGWISLYPADVAWPGTSTLNYRTARTRANASVVTLSADGVLNVKNAGSTVHVIIDVTAYFK
jgi:hypothetical protein